MKAFTLLFTILVFAVLNAGSVDLFKVQEGESTNRLFFHASSDPEIIRSGRNLSVLFRGEDFVREKEVSLATAKNPIRRLNTKNYKEKGGAANIIHRGSFTVRVNRISPDVVRVDVVSGNFPAAVAAKKQEKQAAETVAEKPVPADQEAVPELPKDVKKPLAVAKRGDDVEMFTFDDEKKDDKKKSAAASLSDVGDDSFNGSYLAVISLMLFSVALLLFLKRKKGGSGGILGKSGVMNVVETLPMGFKEKLVLLDVAGSYLLLFVKDKEMKELAVFKGEEALKIRESLLSRKKNMKTESFLTDPEKDSSGNPFRDKLESLIKNESESREKGAGMAVEDKVFQTINQLKGLKLR